MSESTTTRIVTVPPGGIGAFCTGYISKEVEELQKDAEWAVEEGDKYRIRAQEHLQAASDQLKGVGQMNQDHALFNVMMSVLNIVVLLLILDIKYHIFQQIGDFIAR